MNPPLLSNRYQTVRPIGTGDRTRVLEAWDRLTGRAVAIKLPIGQLAHDKAFLLRLERELPALAGFTHPNVAAVLAVERGGDTGLVVVEFVDGASLGDMLADRGPMPPARAAQLAATVCAALAAAHARGIVHGHLTEANVLLAVDGQVKLTDFRIAKAAEPLAGAPDPAADLRALGRLLAVMLTGRGHVDGEPVRLDRTVPEGLAAIVARANDPVEPYRSAAEVGRDLDRFLATIRPDAIQTEQPAPVVSDSTDPLIAATPSGSALVLAPRPLRDAGGAAAARSRRRRALAVAAGLIGAGLVAGGAVTAAMRLDREPNGSTVGVGQAVAAPASSVRTTTSGPRPATGTSTSLASTTTVPPTTAPPATAPSPAVASPPTATTGQVPDPGQRTVPDTVGLRQERAAKVLARVQLSMQSSLTPVSDRAQVNRVVAQQPAAGEVVPAGSQVTVLVGTLAAQPVA
jgi:serine/threonine-protein kinase